MLEPRRRPRRDRRDVGELAGDQTVEQLEVELLSRLGWREQQLLRLPHPRGPCLFVKARISGYVKPTLGRPQRPNNRDIGMSPGSVKRSYPDSGVIWTAALALVGMREERGPVVGIRIGPLGRPGEPERLRMVFVVSVRVERR